MRPPVGNLCDSLTPLTPSETSLTLPARFGGKYGCLPAQIPAALKALPHYAAGPLPAAPAAVPVPGVTAWDPLGNLNYGDCGVAGLEHGFMAAASDVSETEAFPTDAEAVSYYLTYTGGQDSGIVLSQYLAYVKQHGYYGHTVAAYAPVTVSDIPTLQFAVWAYDFAYCGITVTQAMEQAWSAGQPWTADLVDSPVAGGHCVPIVGYDDAWLYAVTWGTVQKIAYPAWHLIATEAWAVITGELASAGGGGISLDALQADLGKLDGPIPAPQPGPADPGPLGELSRLIREIAASADRDISHAVAWLHEHGL